MVGAFRLAPKQIAIQLKADATERLIAEGIHPFGHLREKNGRPPKCFARGEWKVFLDTPEEVACAVQYANDNPAKEGKKPQQWTFVTPFDPLGRVSRDAEALRSGARASPTTGVRSDRET